MNEFFDLAVKWNDKAMGAPSGLVLFVFAICFGYFLKSIPKFDNRYIPLVVVLTCAIGFMILAPVCPPEIKVLAWRVRNLFIGFIIGFGAWTFHAQLLRRFVDPKWFPPDEPDKPDQS